jgi:hypothetical protein
VCYGTTEVCTDFFFLPGALTWLEAYLVYDMTELTLLSGDVSTRCRFLFCIPSINVNLLNVIKKN